MTKIIASTFLSFKMQKYFVVSSLKLVLIQNYEMLQFLVHNQYKSKFTTAKSFHPSTIFFMWIDVSTLSKIAYFGLVHVNFGLVHVMWLLCMAKTRKVLQ